jgi:hypothetical protein
MRATCAWGMTAQTLPNASAWMAGVCRPKTSSTGISSAARSAGGSSGNSLFDSASMRIARALCSRRARPAPAAPMASVPSVAPGLRMPPVISAADNGHQKTFTARR